MNEKLTQLIKEQTKNVIKSLREDKKVWEDIFSVGVAYRKQLNKLFNAPCKRLSK
jgi:hypothetical protein